VLRSVSKSSLCHSPMQAIVVAAIGDSSCLQLRADVPVPFAEPGHLLVKLEYAGVNYIDTYFRSGLYPTKLPFIPGAFPILK
jgi:NADPH2:quinone reductase